MSTSKVGQHVSRREDGWRVRKAGADRASSIHATQADAIVAATRIARNQGTELYIHGEDGLIRERISYRDAAHLLKG